MIDLFIISPSKDNDAQTWAAAVKDFHEVKNSYDFSPVRSLEADMLQGDFNGERIFFDHLEPMRVTLHTLLKRLKPARIHVHLGNDLGTLYAAMECLHFTRIPVSVTVHDPTHIGGVSTWLAAHPLLRRRLALAVLEEAESVWVLSPEEGDILYEHYPRLDRELAYGLNLADLSRPEPPLSS